MSINLRTNEIKDIFSLFDDPLDKYTEIIEFGRKNDSFNDKYKSDSYKIPGCASLAWVYVKKNNSKYRMGVIKIKPIIVDFNKSKHHNLNVILLNPYLFSKINVL